ncbi:MAG: hypothetical protein LBV19_02505 [Streptococcaceae bacterium]|jgi:hypothetical protein|nr:hypothetical protein [Streptococcaceae bacterium]
MKRFFKVILPLTVLSLLILLLLAFLYGRARYQLEFIDDRIFFAAAIAILFLCLYLWMICFQSRIWMKILSLLLVGLASGLLIYAGTKLTSQSTLSLSPDGRHVFVLKRKGGQTTYLQNYFWLFARPIEHLPYKVDKIGKTVWLADDVAAVTYSAKKDGKLHVYVGTYGYRQSAISYNYVANMAAGNWGSAFYQLSIKNDHISVNDQSFDDSHAVQFGTSALVLTTDAAKYVLALPKDFPDSPSAQTKVKLMIPSLENPKVMTLSYEGK